MKFKAIIAMDKNGLVGNGLDLPWKGDASTKFDMVHFKETTTNHIVIMGYNTYKNFKRPLKNRLNLVIGRPEENEQFYSLKNPDGISLPLEESDEISIEIEPVSINDNVNKVDMTQNNLSGLFNFIPLESIDYRFVYIPPKILTDKIENTYTFDHLNRNFEAAKSIAVSAYERSGLNDDSINKIKNMDLSTAYIIGGAKTYERYIDCLDEFIVTELDGTWKGDVFFNKDLLKKFSKSEILQETDSGRIIRYFN